MTGSLSREQVTYYREKGYLSPLPAVPEDEMAGLLGRLRTFQNEHPADAKAAFATKTHLLFPWLYDLAKNDTVLDAVESLIGPDILLWSSGFFMKRPHDTSYVSWHQDSTYWGLEPPDHIITAWVAFTPSTRANGCMRVVPGTQQAGQLAHKDTFAKENLLSRGQEVQVEVDEAQAVDIVLQPGQMSLHHVRIVHGSEANPSDGWRIGFTLRYIPTSVRQIGDRPTALLCRGRDRFGHFEDEPRPAADFDVAARAYHAEVMRRLNAVLYDGAPRRPAA